MRFANYLLLLLPVGLFSCDDLIVPDIGSKSTVILAPVDSAIFITASSVTFRWEAGSGAAGYQLQIAEPAFANATRYLLDTVTSKTTFSKLLVPGAYQWRIRAVNSSYSGPYTTRLIRIDSATNISSEELILSQPDNGSFTNAAVVTLSWMPVTTAERYNVHMIPSPRNSTVAFDTILYGVSQLPLRLPAQDQQYQWSVTALNTTGSSQSSIYTFSVDVTAPVAPTLVAPLDSASVTLCGVMAFSWTRNATDVVRDSLFLYLANQATKLTSFPRSFTTTSYSWLTSDTLLTTGTYFWAVRSVDRAGNAGALSAKRPLRLQ